MKRQLQEITSDEGRERHIEKEVGGEREMGRMQRSDGGVWRRDRYAEVGGRVHQEKTVRASKER